MKPLFIYYPNCGTCRKAFKWLKANHIDVDMRDIVMEHPTETELSRWVPLSNLDIFRFFNTSGVRYKELGVKDLVKAASREELIKLLASDGKLVKRPLLVTGNLVLVGFKEGDWMKKLLSK